MRARSLVKGLLSFVPGLDRIVLRDKQGGHTGSAEYCYSVWLKHLTLLGSNGMTVVPPTIGELGPGSSIGVGLAALLSGANHYVSLDVVRHTEVARNLAVFDALVRMFQARAPRPDKGWPDFDGLLDERLFPSHILTPELLARTLAPERLAAIRHAIASPSGTSSGEVSIRYIAPWSDASVVEEGSLDLIVSHSVLEHVTDLDATYAALYRWLRPGGRMSHQIDFKSHGLSSEWNGYRRCSELTWKLTHGRRPFLINREPYSAHMDLIRRAGFDIDLELTNIRHDGIARSELSPRWKDLSDTDLNCSGVFLQARKPVNVSARGNGKQFATPREASLA